MINGHDNFVDKHRPREILRDGQYGQLVPVGDIAALAQAIEMTIGGKIPSPPQECRRRFEPGAVVNQDLKALLAR